MGVAATKTPGFNLSVPLHRTTELEKLTVAIAAVSNIRNVMGFKDRGIGVDREDFLGALKSVQEDRARVSRLRTFPKVEIVISPDALRSRD